ncbi:MAG: polysaccharide deacetylase family protein [Candidatus Omnitrophota bacterium]
MRPEGVRVLMYHSVGGKPSDHRIGIRVPVENFTEQLDEILRAGYVTLTVSEFIRNRASGNVKKSIVITFDDGYKDNVINAASMLKTRNMKATFFVTTSYIDGKAKKIWSDGSAREYMDWQDVAGLPSMGFEVGSHMVEHCSLTLCDNDNLVFQMEGSKNRIFEMSGFESKVFSYPYGNVNDKVIDVAKRAGYIGACSSFGGVNYKDTDPYVLRRTEVDGYDRINDFKDKLNGCYDWK